MNLEKTLDKDLKKFQENNDPEKYPNPQRPAYPTNNRMFSAAQGLTKREYFAAMAMQGLVAKEGWSERIMEEGGDKSLCIYIAAASVKMADELLKQLEQ